MNGVEHIYTLSGTQIISEAWGTNLLIYLYNESGSPIGMQYRNDAYAADTFFTFFFEKNLQGDITAVYNENGVKVLSYTYDAWGNHTTTWHTGMGTDLFADYNPFRYRGYYYDTETGWYYLQSRYYNPAWGRFLNADGYVNANGDLIGFNMYAYCGNNPIMFTDPFGERFSNNISQVRGDLGYVSIDERCDRLFSWAQANSVKLYSSEMEAAQAWADQYRLLSKEREHVAYIYGVNVTIGSTPQTFYYLSETLRGADNNVITQVIAMEIQSNLIYYDSVSMIHSHPNPGEGKHNDFPSLSYSWFGFIPGPGGDKVAMKMCGYNNMYIVPYKCCDGAQSILSYNDRNTWCPKHPYK